MAIGLGSTLGEGALLKGMNTVRFLGHYICLPFTIIAIGSMARQAGFKWAQYKVVMGAFCALAIYFMGHDLWPRPNALKAFHSIRGAFPNLKRFLFSDTYRSDFPAPGHTPIFTLGFEFTHELMGQFIPSVAEWEDLFEESGWELRKTHELAIPYSCIFDLRVANANAGTSASDA